MIDGKRVYFPVDSSEAPKVIRQANTEHTEHKTPDGSGRKGTARPAVTAKTTLREAAKVYVKSLRARRVFRMEEDADRVLHDRKTGFLHIPFVPNLPVYVKDIRAEHFTGYINALHKLHENSTGAHDRQGDRTIENKAHHLRRFLQWADHPGLKWRELIKRAERPTPNAFSDTELTTLRQHAGELSLERILLEMGCQLGLRVGELTVAEFTDVDRERRIYTVRSKPNFNFKVKKSKQRSVPISKGLIELLDKWKATLPIDQKIVFARKGSFREPHAGSSLYNRLSRLAVKAGVTDAHPHRMRRTAITRWIRSGVDLPTVQKLAGHENSQTTLESYAAPLSIEDSSLHERMAEIWSW